jgi:hypothetical protein
VSIDQLADFSDWLATDPTVPQGKWFKCFSDFTICGENELVKTFLLSNQLPDGEEVF